MAKSFRNASIEALRLQLGKLQAIIVTNLTFRVRESLRVTFE